jgi:hypothetical protein
MKGRKKMRTKKEKNITRSTILYKLKVLAYDRDSKSEREMDLQSLYYPFTEDIIKKCLGYSNCVLIDIISEDSVKVLVKLPISVFMKYGEVVEDFESVVTDKNNEFMED